MHIERRDSAMIIIFSAVTCGLYQIYWYSKMYDELGQLTGETPTGHAFILDFLLVIFTCTLYGIYVDYKISKQLLDLNIKYGLPQQDTATAVVLLDCAAFVTGALTNVISSAIHQDQLNKITRTMDEQGATHAMAAT